MERKKKVQMQQHSTHNRQSSDICFKVPNQIRVKAQTKCSDLASEMKRREAAIQEFENFFSSLENDYPNP